jgi:hypothetical protein
MNKKDTYLMNTFTISRWIVNIKTFRECPKYCNPNLGFTIEARGWRLQAKRKTQESHHMLLGVQKV